LSTRGRFIFVSYFLILGTILSLLAVSAREFGVLQPEVTPDYHWSFNYVHYNPTGFGVRELILDDGTYDLQVVGPNLQVINETDTQVKGTILTHNGGSFAEELNTRINFDSAYSGDFTAGLWLYFNTLPTQDYTLFGHGDENITAGTSTPARGWRVRFASSTIIYEGSTGAGVYVTIAVAVGVNAITV